jgi:hypothetical protein
MGAVDGLGKAVVVNSAQSTFSPFRRNILIITAIFFVILGVVGVIESFEANSIEPLYSRTLGKILASDYELGRYVEELAGGNVPHFEGFFVKSFPHFLGFWFLFVVNVVADLYFVFFLFWILYWCWSLLDTSKVLRNVLLALGSYVVLSFLIGTAMFIHDASGKTLPQNSMSVWLDKTYPFEGTVKFVTFFISRESLTRIADWSESPIGGFIVNTPQGVNNSGT